MDDSHLFPPDTCPDLRELSTLFAAPVQWGGNWGLRNENATMRYDRFRPAARARARARARAPRPRGGAGRARSHRRAPPPQARGDACLASRERRGSRAGHFAAAVAGSSPAGARDWRAGAPPGGRDHAHAIRAGLLRPSSAGTRGADRARDQNARCGAEVVSVPPLFLRAAGACLRLGAARAGEHAAPGALQRGQQGLPLLRRGHGAARLCASCAARGDPACGLARRGARARARGAPARRSEWLVVWAAQRGEKGEEATVLYHAVRTP